MMYLITFPTLHKKLEVGAKGDFHNINTHSLGVSKGSKYRKVGGLGGGLVID